MLVKLITLTMPKKVVVHWQWQIISEIWQFHYLHTQDFQFLTSWDPRKQQNSSVVSQTMQRKEDSQVSIQTFSSRYNCSILVQYLSITFTSRYHWLIGKLCVIANQFRWTSKSVDRLHHLMRMTFSSPVDIFINNSLTMLV